jgi:PAS domain S-box-containing protein
MRDPDHGPKHERAHESACAEDAALGLANALPEIVWLCDPAGRLRWVNERWYQLTGLTADETLRPLGSIVAVHPDDRSALQCAWSRALEQLTTLEIEFRIRATNGAFRWHLVRAAPLRDAEGNVTGWAAAGMDIQARRDAADALSASERRFQAVFDLSPQPTAITRYEDGVFLSVNDAFLRVSGFTREEVVGRTPVALGIWTAEERAEVVAHLRASPGEREVPFTTKTGRSVVLALTSTPVDFGGEPCMITTARDVTERRAAELELRESEARARARADDLVALMEAVPAVVWIADDPSCKHMRANRAGHEILRIPAGENLSKTAPDSQVTRHFDVYVGGVKVEPDQLPLQRATRGAEVRNYEEEIRFDDGEVKHLYGNVVPLRDPSGAPRGAIGAFVDVTRLKQAEAAMREADRRKDEFLAILSHELRNPLAPIITATQLMKLKGDVPAPDQLEVILRQAQHLVGLVDDLLDVSRVARGKVTLSRRTQEVGDIVAKAVEATAALLEERRQRLSLSVPRRLLVSADSMRLTQVFSNLLTNAARYTPPGGHVSVVACREGDEVVLRFRDSGVGIDGALLPHVFEMFVQGEQGPERPGGGLGLGLSLVRTLTLLHGGAVSADSAGPGKGSEFTVRLPAAAPAVEQTPAPQPRSATKRIPKGQVQRVLVVDDNRDAASMIAYLLTDAGHEVLVANDPFQALLSADSFRPQVAILDIGLPAMDGYALGKELRKRLAGAPPVLIALTGYGQDQDKRRSVEAGFAFHLVKPFGAEKLVHLVGQVAECEPTKGDSIKIEHRP